MSSKYFLVYPEKEEIKTEIIRKSLHMLIAFVPLLAGINVFFTIALLGAGIFSYTFFEKLRLDGVSVAFVTWATTASSRTRDEQSFVLGPITLGLGAMMALLLYPQPAAILAIYALAFGDSFSSLIGKMYGKVEIPFSGGKTFAGSFACLLSVFLVSYSVTYSLRLSAGVAIAATFFEVLPLEDLDNVVVPVGVGLVAQFLLL